MGIGTIKETVGRLKQTQFDRRRAVIVGGEVAGLRANVIERQGRALHIMRK